MINAVDKGNSGRLSFENFETAIMRKIMSKDSDGDIMKSFRLFDMDDQGNNHLRYVELVYSIPEDACHCRGSVCPILLQLPEYVTVIMFFFQVT